MSDGSPSAWTQLTPAQRELIEQCYLGAKPIKRIAAERSLEPSALYKRLDRIRWTLMDCIETPDGREDAPMNSPLGIFDGAEELREWIAGVWNGTIAPEDRQRLEARLADDDAAREYYLSCMALHAQLLWQFRGVGGQGSGVGGQGAGGQVVGGQWPVASDPPSTIPPIVIDPSPTLHSSLGSFVFSHIAAAVILGIGLLIGLAWRISLPSSEGPAPENRRIVNAQKIGRITALADCKWSKQGPGISKTKDQRPKTVFFGDKFVLVSGLMQITYDTGARVILEGPCTYEIDSARGGYLAVGKLTARVEKGSGVRDPGSGSENLQICKSANQQNAGHYQLPTTNYQLFTVRTPTATVTDLGTEFGVEVEKSGATRSHVFQGKVKLVASGQWPVVSDGNSRRLTTSGDSVEILHAGESARVERGRNNRVVVVCESSQPIHFVRQMPGRVRIALFNTGVRLKKEAPDPHWQVVAASNDPQFKPRPALVTAIGTGYESFFLPNDPARSQWIASALDGIMRFGPSIISHSQRSPRGRIVYTFHTTFDLSGMLPDTAILQGRLLAGNNVAAIRLNGRNLDVPKYKWTKSLIHWATFQTDRGFVEGINVLEIDVFNDCYEGNGHVLCRVELEGSALRAAVGTTNRGAGATRREANPQERESKP